MINAWNSNTSGHKVSEEETLASMLGFGRDIVKFWSGSGYGTSEREILLANWRYCTDGWNEWIEEVGEDEIEEELRRIRKEAEEEIRTLYCLVFGGSDVVR